ncbi:MAG: hypothetical protein CMH54_05520 [Myxococcales bacterium]|nr:hypothetical protein [Myxococcales bacterium]|tara:strand:- start:706 stop:1173 length:468 start_codon:yes stop_codon:yes gene_type:complete
MHTWVRFLGFALLVACSAGTDGSDPDIGSDTDLATPLDEGQNNCEVEPTFTSLQTSYFKTSCAFGSCHGGDNPEAGLDLSENGSYGDLINVEAVLAPGRILVIPNDPDNSYLYEKVTANPPAVGALMPIGTAEPVDPECRIKMLRQWIEDGAQDN